MYIKLYGKTYKVHEENGKQYIVQRKCKKTLEIIESGLGKYVTYTPPKPRSPSPTSPRSPLSPSSPRSPRSPTSPRSLLSPRSSSPYSLSPTSPASPTSSLKEENAKLKDEMEIIKMENRGLLKLVRQHQHAEQMMERRGSQSPYNSPSPLKKQMSPSPVKSRSASPRRQNGEWEEEKSEYLRIIYKLKAEKDEIGMELDKLREEYEVEMDKLRNSLKEQKDISRSRIQVQTRQKQQVEQMPDSKLQDRMRALAADNVKLRKEVAMYEDERVAVEREFETLNNEIHALKRELRNK